MIGDRIRRKRLAAGISLQDLADSLIGERVHLSKAALSNYETNKTLPNAAVLWALAKIFGVSMEYFVREQETAITLGYRKRSRLGKQKHDQIIAIVRDEIEKRIEIEKILGLEPIFEPLVQQQISSLDEAEGIAEKTRHDWNLGDQPIASVTALLEDKGWYVIHSPDEEAFDGLAGFVQQNNRPFAVSRGGISVDRLRLNLLHEAGHVFIKSQEERLTEKAAFRFAAAMLFPRTKVYEEVGKSRSSLSMDQLVLLKLKYGLSIQAMVFRFRDLGIISGSYLSLILAYLNKLRIRVEEPGSKDLTFQEVPTAFRTYVYRARSEGLISEHDFAIFLPDLAARTGRPGLGSSAELKRMLSLPTEELEEVLEAAASAARGDYEKSDVNLG